MENVLIKNSEKYSGLYVTTRSFRSKTVVTYGKDPVKTYKEAQKKGVKDPVLFFVPEKDMRHIY
ncbi:MAG: DUF5678 domain-containing protein [Thermodesulfobacteriota bacterium]